MPKQNYFKNKFFKFAEPAAEVIGNFHRNNRFVSGKCRGLLYPALFFFILALLPSTIDAQSGQKSNTSAWTGSYYFSEMAQSAKRRHSFDVVPSVSYDITIEGKERQLTATFSVNGVQLFEAYECSVAVVGDKLEFYYQRPGSDDIKNFRKFVKGDLLFSLSRVQINKKTAYLFQPAAYKIVHLIPARKKAPVYFEKPKVGF